MSTVIGLLCCVMSFFFFQILTYTVSSFLVHMKVRQIFSSFIFINFYGLSNSKGLEIHTAYIESPFTKS